MKGEKEAFSFVKANAQFNDQDWNVFKIAPVEAAVV
jgi:hypothetical protein